jgi:hypothetical protein
VEKKIGSEKKCALPSSKVREFGQKIHVHGNTIKEYLTKIGVHCNPKNPHLKPQHINNPSSKLG